MFHCKRNIPVCLVIGVEVCLGKIESGFVRGVDLSGTHHIDPQPLFRHDLVDTLERVGLGGVERDRSVIEVLAEGRLVRSAFLADLVLVHEIQGRSVFLSQRCCVLAGKQQHSLF